MKKIMVVAVLALFYIGTVAAHNDSSQENAYLYTLVMACKKGRCGKFIEMCNHVKARNILKSVQMADDPDNQWCTPLPYAQKLLKSGNLGAALIGAGVKISEKNYQPINPNDRTVYDALVSEVAKQNPYFRDVLFCGKYEVFAHNVEGFLGLLKSIENGLTKEDRYEPCSEGRSV